MRRAPATVLLLNHGLHMEIRHRPQRTRSAEDGRRRRASDIILEAATTTIMDLEDAVSTCVDAEDKVLAYRNWLGLVKGDLTDRFEKGGRMVDRAMNAGPRIHRAGRLERDPARESA